MSVPLDATLEVENCHFEIISVVSSLQDVKAESSEASDFGSRIEDRILDFPIVSTEAKRQQSQETTTMRWTTTNQSNKRRSNMIHRRRLPLLHALLFTLSFSIAATTTAFVPPRPGSDLEKRFETVYAYRQRMGIQYNYTPSLLNMELCRNLSEEECENADRAMQDHATSHKEIQTKLWRQRRRHLQERENSQTDNTPRAQQSSGRNTNNNTQTRESTQQEWDQQDFHQQLGVFTKAYGRGPHNQPTLQEELEELDQLLQEFNTTKEQYYRRHLQFGGPSDRSTATHNPSVGTFVVPLLLMRFADHASRQLPEKYHYQILWNLRIKKFLDENSYGRYYAFFDVQDWEQTDNTEEYYSFGESGRIAAFSDSFFPLLDSMDERLGGDWGIYDANGDGFLDNLIVIHSGYGAEEGGQDCTNGRTSESRIWSHAFANSAGWTSSNGNYRTRGYMIAAGLDLLCNSNVAKMGVMTHEYLHTFFLIDLYDTQFVGKGMGNFDIMAYPYGHANDGYIPVHLSAWAKQTIEWLECTVITSSGEYMLEPAATSSACYKLVLVDFTKWEEYILFENRQQTNFDINFWESGLVMYHIDEGAEDQMWAGYPGLDEYWPETGDHYRVAVIQADGEYDLERNKNNGDKDDVWKPGMVLGPNDDGKTFPNTDGYQDGFIEYTGYKIEILESDQMNVRFRVDMGQRSGGGNGNSRPAFSAPRKEGAHDLAEDQFTVPDNPNQRISGMIPQMPWFEEWKQREQQDAILEEQSQQRPPATTTTESTTTFAVSIPPDEVLDGIFSRGWQRYSGILTGTLSAVLLSVSLCH